MIPYHDDRIPHVGLHSLPDLFYARVKRSPGEEAYRQYLTSTGWRSYTWQEAGNEVARWRHALQQMALPPGERVALWLSNSVAWVFLDLAAMAQGLVIVPLYAHDAAENVAGILADAKSRLLVVESLDLWQSLQPWQHSFPCLEVVICQTPDSATTPSNPNVHYLASWLPADDPAFEPGPVVLQELATIIYTSGTTGRPKGVMLSHANLLWNAAAILEAVPGYPADRYLSILPLSHALERTVGYYVPMMAGSTVVHGGTIKRVAEDLLHVKPTVLVAVPRVFERIHAQILHQVAVAGGRTRQLFQQLLGLGWQDFQASQHLSQALTPERRLLWRAARRLIAYPLQKRLGGRLRIAVSGGAPLAKRVAHDLVGLGLPLLQGYGLTEASPVVAANRLGDNDPDSVGRPLPGVEVRIGDQDELLVKSPGVMLGYWGRAEETRQAITPDGWLRTGDRARLRAGRLYILGRIKDLIVLSTGEKIAPADLEAAMLQDGLFENVMVVGEGKPYLGALVVLNPEKWHSLATELGLANSAQDLASSAARAVLLARIDAQLHAFAPIFRVHGVFATLNPWTVENGLLTPTLKVKRGRVEERFRMEIGEIYRGHDLPEAG